VFSVHEQKAILVYRLAQLVDGLNGVDLYATDADALWGTANDVTCGLSNDQIRAGFIGIFNSTMPDPISVNPGSSPAELTAATAASGITCLVNFSDDQLERMQFFLLCTFFSSLGFT